MVDCGYLQVHNDVFSLLETTSSSDTSGKPAAGVDLLWPTLAHTSAVTLLQSLAGWLLSHTGNDGQSWLQGLSPDSSHPNSPQTSEVVEDVGPGGQRTASEPKDLQRKGMRATQNQHVLPPFRLNVIRASQSVMDMWPVGRDDLSEGNLL